MKKLISVLIALILVLSAATVSFADFGDYAGSSDWGGGYDSGWGGGYDSGWSSGYDYYDYGYGYYDSGSYSGDIGFLEIVITAIVIIIIIASFFVKAKASRGNSSGGAGYIPPLENDIDSLKDRDPAFSESKFLGDAANLYIRLQNAWTAGDLSPVRTRLTEELFARSERQVMGYKNNGQTNHVDRPSVLNSRIVGCTKDDKNDIITVEINARIIDYVTDDRTGKIIRGSNSKELFMTYRWTFIRTLGRTTAESGEVDDRHCPSCGAPIDLNRSAVCEYCGSVCTSGNYDWVLSDIQGISQRS